MDAKLILNYARGLVNLRSNDIWLPSFPKTGSTWVRFLLCNTMLLTQEDEPTHVDFHVLDASMPALGHHSLLKPWPFEHFPRFVKTHQLYRGVLFARPRRTVYVIRDPRDVMVSYFHFQQAHTLRPFAGAFDEFIRHPKYGLEACLRHYDSWRHRITHLARYEALKQDTLQEFQNMLEAVGVHPSAQLIERAVERSEFSRVRKAQDTSGLSGKQRFKSTFKFARSGTTNQWPEYFSNEDLDLYASLRRKYRFEFYQDDHALLAEAPSSS